MSDHLPGDFLVVRTRGWKGWVIRAVTQSEVNHAAILMPNGRLLEARPGGAGWQDVARYDGCLKAWSHLDLTDTQRVNICARAKEFEGTPYGWRDVIALGLAKLGIRHPWVASRLHDPTTVFCSQMVAVCYDDAGVIVPPTAPGASRLDPASVDPSALLATIAGLA